MKRAELLEPSFDEIAALIEDAKADALARFDDGAFRRRVLRRHDARRTPDWLGSARLVAGCAAAGLLAASALLLPSRPRPAIEARVVARALRHAHVAPAAHAGATRREPARSDLEWRIERALLTWHRLQRGPVDVECALEQAAVAGAARKVLATQGPRETAGGAAPSAVRRRLERSLSALDRDGTVHRALVAGRRT